jgi:hypothetical protein
VCGQRCSALDEIMISFSVSKVNPSHLAALQSSLLGGDLLGGTRFEEAEKLAEMLTERVLGTFFDDSGEAAPVRARPSTGASQDSRRLRSEAQARSSTDIRHNDRFENDDAGEINLIFLDLASCVRWTEISLLAHNLSKQPPTIWRPSQDELLGTLCLGFFENEGNALECLRIIKDQPDGLSTRIGGTPASYFS